MNCRLVSLLAALSFALPVGEAAAQFPFRDELTENYLNFMQAEFRKHRQAEQEAVRRAMADPQVQVRYRQYQAAGGRESFQVYAHGFVLTGGYTPRGSQNFRDTTERLGRRDAAAIREFHQHVGDLQRDIMDHRARLSQRQAEMIGDELLGEAPYVDRHGRRHYLPTTLPAHQPRFNEEGGVYERDLDGDYYYDSGDGQEELEYDR